MYSVDCNCIPLVCGWCPFVAVYSNVEIGITIQCSCSRFMFLLNSVNISCLLFPIHSSTLQTFGQINQNHVSTASEKPFPSVPFVLLRISLSFTTVEIHLFVSVLLISLWTWQDLLKTTPVDHKDYAVLQEVLRLSRSFLSGINESSQSKRGVTLSHGMVSPLLCNLCYNELQKYLI